jgi:hypothetical protein
MRADAVLIHAATTIGTASTGNESKMRAAPSSVDVPLASVFPATERAPEKATDLVARTDEPAQNSAGMESRNNAAGVCAIHRQADGMMTVPDVRLPAVRLVAPRWKSGSATHSFAGRDLGTVKEHGGVFTESPWK